MQKDLIKNDFAEEIDINILKKIINLFKYLIALSCAYHIFNIYDWYTIFLKEPLNTFASFYLHRIHPFTALGIIAISIYNLFSYFKVYKLLLSAINNKNPQEYNYANKIIYRTIILSILLISVSIVSIIIRLSSS